MIQQNLAELPSSLAQLLHFSNCRATMTLGPLDCDLISPSSIKARCQSETRWKTLNLALRSEVRNPQHVHSINSIDRYLYSIP